MFESRRGVAELPHICRAFGVSHAIISPGSRNAPLVLAFTSHPEIRCLSITDERSAGYYAVGMAQQLRQPVVIICTSGTAMVNYGPALAEAYYLKLPVIAISADRPAEWIDQNDGQTIRQRNLFDNLVKGSFETPMETKIPEDHRYFQRMISEAFHIALSGTPGPVHINVPLREPLYDPLPEVKSPVPVICSQSRSFSNSSFDISDLENTIRRSVKVLIVCGMADDDESVSSALQQISLTGKAVVIAENLSNFHCENCIETPDSFMASMTVDEKKAFHPDLLITIGGAVVSKKLKRYLREYKPANHWHVDIFPSLIDTFQSLSHTVQCPPALFLKSIFPVLNESRSFTNLSRKVSERLHEAHNIFLESVVFSDLKAYDEILNSLPVNSVLHLANSTPVRYSQLFRTNPDVRYYSNRGTSGIDGCISTAAGAAMVNNKLHVAITGDLAFIYDSNGLWNSKLPENLRIIVVDNGGGNIFRLIDTSPLIEPVRHFFETPHNVRIDKLCEAFSIEYLKVSEAEEIRSGLTGFFKPKPGTAVMHIVTDGEISASVFKQYYQYISQKLWAKKEIGQN